MKKPDHRATSARLCACLVRARVRVCARGSAKFQRDKYSTACIRKRHGRATIWTSCRQSVPLLNPQAISKEIRQVSRVFLIACQVWIGAMRWRRGGGSSQSRFMSVRVNSSLSLSSYTTPYNFVFCSRNHDKSRSKEPLQGQLKEPRKEPLKEPLSKSVKACKFQGIERKKRKTPAAAIIA